MKKRILGRNSVHEHEADGTNSHWSRVHRSTGPKRREYTEGAPAVRQTFNFSNDTLTNIYEWKCVEGHTWRESASDLFKGKGCEECLVLYYKYPHVLAMFAPDLNYIKDISNLNYTNTSVFTWKCNHGHVFVDSVRRICSRKHLCKECFTKERTTREKLITLKYVNPTIDRIISLCIEEKNVPISQIFILNEKASQISIEHLKFSARTYNCLRRHFPNKSIITLEEIMSITYQELYKIRNLGETSQIGFFSKIFEYIQFKI